MESSGSNELQRRVDERIRAWRVVVERREETESSILAFGRRDDQPVVLKVIRNRGDEWRSGEVLETFEGRGIVRVYDYADGALLLERLCPGNSLAGMAVNGDDDRATAIVAEVIGRMCPRTPAVTVPAVQDWARDFERYAPSGAARIPLGLIAEAHSMYAELCDSQSRPRLLHGDLHHNNVLFDAGRGWLATDPKGVVGELEFELGAVLRNPYENPALFTEPSVIARRIERLASELSLDAGRILAWGFAQAVLAAVWVAEEGGAVGPDHPWIALANTFQPLL